MLVLFIVVTMHGYQFYICSIGGLNDKRLPAAIVVEDHCNGMLQMLAVVWWLDIRVRRKREGSSSIGGQW